MKWASNATTRKKNPKSWQSFRRNNLMRTISRFTHLRAPLIKSRWVSRQTMHISETLSVLQSLPRKSKNNSNPLIGLSVRSLTKSTLQRKRRQLVGERLWHRLLHKLKDLKMEEIRSSKVKSLKKLRSRFWARSSVSTTWTSWREKCQAKTLLRMRGWRNYICWD